MVRTGGGVVAWTGDRVDADIRGLSNRSGTKIN